MSAAIPAAPAQETLPIGLLFPGGERQYVGIMSSVKDIPAVQDMFERAKPVLRFDLLKLCLEGPAEELAKVCEPVMYIAGLAGVEKLRREREEAVRRARGMAGAGVGECVALVAAGVFSFEDGLALVRARSDSICGVAGVRKQATAVIAGLDKAKLTELCTAAVKRGGSGAVCQISGDLFTLGFTVGGTEKSVRVLKDLAEKAGAVRVHMELANARSLAHNTPLLEPAKEMLSAFLDELLPKMSPPRVSVYMTATATPVRPGTPPKDVAAVLKEEMTSMMLWAPSIKAMIKEGVSQFYEVGPGETLKGHMRHIDAKLWRSMTNMLV